MNKNFADSNPFNLLFKFLFLSLLLYVVFIVVLLLNIIVIRLFSFAVNIMYRALLWGLLIVDRIKLVS